MHQNLRIHTTLSFISLVAFGTLLSTGTSSGRDRELIKNGKFESALANWTVVSSNGGAQGNFISDNVGSTIPGPNAPTAANPAGGALYAVSVHSGPSYQILAQRFRVPKSAKRVRASYQMFVHSAAAITRNPALFDITGTNQQGRVDILKGGSSLLATGGFAKTLYNLGADAVSSPTAIPYRSYRFNLTRNLKAGRTYQIRFAATVTESPLFLGVDNVSVKAR